MSRPSTPYTNAIVRLLSERDANRQLEELIAKRKQEIGASSNSEAADQLGWIGIASGPGIQPPTPEADRVLDQMCEGINLEDLPIDVLASKGKDFNRYFDVGNRERESFWRDFYTTMSDEDKALIDSKVVGAPKTVEISRSRFGQIAIESPTDFRLYLKSRCLNIQGRR
ncbi:MAG: hypothetical protein AAF098_14580 [Pseudomonadota bacterium]